MSELSDVIAKFEKAVRETCREFLGQKIGDAAADQLMLDAIKHTVEDMIGDMLTKNNLEIYYRQDPANPGKAVFGVREK